ncbi:GntR family transcriptional regulator [Ahrensia marina]|nr:GntR family transcriptional regulator [Ahrensia marina]
MYDPSSPMLRPVTTAEGVPAPEAKARFAEDRLLDAVIWCEIEPGEVVTEADMMDRFGLTRAAARSGLTRLGYDGWATPQPRTGWLVLPVTGALIGQVLDARRVAEPALGDLKLSADSKAELIQIASVIEALYGRTEAGAVASFRHYVNRIDGLMLQSINPFTARHLRKLWHHSARITHFLEGVGDRQLFHRVEIRELVQAILDGDGEAIRLEREKLIEEQETFFLRQLLKSDTPLMSGNGSQARPKPTTSTKNRREA